MHILVINCGSSSVKADIFSSLHNTAIHSLRIERIPSNPTFEIDTKSVSIMKNFDSYASILEYGIKLLLEGKENLDIQVIGHRVAHGGNEFKEAVRIDEIIKNKIQALCEIAPLHNPVALSGIQVAEKLFPAIMNVAVFDTAFHQTLPNRAKHYALPKEINKKYNIRKYGFHGTSHEYVANLAAHYLNTTTKNLRIISCHLGSGCSIAAIEYGQSVETSMGMTPLEGLVMGTRSGDIDAGVLMYIAEKENLTITQLNEMLNKKSGLLGLAGINDMRDIIQKSSEGDDDARLAMQVFCHRIKKYIGAYTAVMGGVDAIIFTGGIGENSPIIRHRICERMDYLGIIMDEDKNTESKLSVENPVFESNATNSKVKVLVVRTDEQLAIAKQSLSLLQEQDKVNSDAIIPIAVSARHIHLSQEHVEILFGPNYQLTEYKPLSQPGQYACNEMLTIVGPKNKLENVRILGPVRKASQVEISRTDEFVLGLDAPVRESGNTANSPGVTLVGPHGKLVLTEGLICAWRHIHMNPAEAADFGVKDRDVVEIEVLNGEKSLTFGNVLIRVHENFKLEMHIDTDEANAAEIKGCVNGKLLKRKTSN